VHDEQMKIVFWFSMIFVPKKNQIQNHNANQSFASYFTKMDQSCINAKKPPKSLEKLSGNHTLTYEIWSKNLLAQFINS